MTSWEQASRRCDRLVRKAQRDHRIPALTAAVARADRPLWTAEVGLAERDVPVTADHQFRIGSVTKTFTAVLVMQLRDQGRLDLDDALDRHLPVPAHGDVTVRTLLTHMSGLQREIPGDVWDTLQFPTIEQLIGDLARAERVSKRGRRWHYSNLGFILLGELASRLRGAAWGELVTDRILRPLEMRRTTLAPVAPVATGYLVDAYSDHARPEPPMAAEQGALGAAGQLWSTVTDLATWARFLAAPDPAVLAPETLDEMCQPQTIRDPDDWRVGWGLGLILVPQRSGETQPGASRVVHVGHDGAMPGYLAGVYARRADGVGAVALGSSGTAGETNQLPHALIAESLDADPPDIEPWVPGDPAPAELADVLGPWWSEGSEFVFSWHHGHLQARAREAPAEQPPAVFAHVDGDVYRVASGREAGEALRLTRGADGRVSVMHWAGYPVTRSQQTFGASNG